MNPLRSARTELESLLKQKAEIDRKIDAVTESIRLLESVYAPDIDRTHNTNLAQLMDELDNIGITEAVERALMTKPGKRFYPTQVIDLLAKNAYQVVGDNPIATVQTALKRLVGVGPGAPFVAEEDAAGKTLYKCVAVFSKGHRGKKKRFNT